MDIEIKLRPLTTVQRSQAKERAVKATLREIGDKPSFAQFENTSVGKFPPELINRVTRLAYGFLLAAFIPSAIRLFAIGYTTFHSNIESKVLAALVASCVVALAEIGAILFTLAFAVLPVHRLTRVLLISAMLVSVSISLVGNYTFALHGHRVNVFTWLEALGPPSLTLITAYILKEVGLDAIKRRHADKVAYDHALNEWQGRIEAVEHHGSYMSNLANSYWDAIVTKNRAITDGVEFDAATKSHYVRFELQQDNWYQALDVSMSKPSSQTDIRQVDMANASSDSTNRPSSQTLVYTFLDSYPDYRHNGTVRELAAAIESSGLGKVGKDTAEKYRKAYLHAHNGHTVSIQE